MEKETKKKNYQISLGLTFWILLISGLAHLLFANEPSILGFLITVIVTIPVLIIAFIIFILIYNLRTKQMTFANLVNLVVHLPVWLPEWLAILFSKKMQKENKEAERINAILQQQCDNELFIEEATQFLSGKVSAKKTLISQWNISFSYYKKGDLDKAIEIFENLVNHMKANTKIPRGIKKSHLFDQLVFYHLVNNDLVQAGYYARLRDDSVKEEKDSNHDELFPYSQGYLAFVEGRYEDALTYYKRREAFNKDKNIAQALFKVDIAHHLSLIYEKLGMEEEMVDSLILVAKFGGKFKNAKIAREKLASLGVSFSENHSDDEEALDIDESETQAKPINLGYGIAVIILAMIAWAWISSSR